MFRQISSRIRLPRNSRDLLHAANLLHIIKINFNFQLTKIHMYGVSYENYPPVNKWHLVSLYSCELPTCFPKMHQFTQFICLTDVNYAKEISRDMHKNCGLGTECYNTRNKIRTDKIAIRFTQPTSFLLWYAMKIRC